MRIKQIDGLRFWACMVILADHCRVLGLRYQGGIMVSLFFVLSGFFIANPQKQDGEERFLSLKGWEVSISCASSASFPCTGLPSFLYRYSLKILLPEHGFSGLCFLWKAGDICGF